MSVKIIHTIKLQFRAKSTEGKDKGEWVYPNSNLHDFFYGVDDGQLISLEQMIAGQWLPVEGYEDEENL